jgi:hypothetical protein
MLDKTATQNPNFDEAIRQRNSLSSDGSPFVQDDYRLTSGEAANRFMHIDLSKPRVEVDSRGEVEGRLRRNRLGVLFFNINELFGRDVGKIVPDVRGKPIRMVIKDGSDLLGWTSAMARACGYKEFEPQEPDVRIPHFEKIIRG